jgi:hypothetical protein
MAQSDRMTESRHPTERPLAWRDIARLSDGELAIWLQRAQFRWALSRRFSLGRWRWRRASLRAMREFGDRLLRHAGAIPALCDRCKQQSATTHWAYGEGDALRFGHFCDVCSRAEPAGWFVTSSARAP